MRSTQMPGCEKCQAREVPGVTQLFVAQYLQGARGSGRVRRRLRSLRTRRGGRLRACACCRRKHPTGGAGLVLWSVRRAIFARRCVRCHSGVRRGSEDDGDSVDRDLERVEVLARRFAGSDEAAVGGRAVMDRPVSLRRRLLGRRSVAWPALGGVRREWCVNQRARLRARRQKLKKGRPESLLRACRGKEATGG